LDSLDVATLRGWTPIWVRGSSADATVEWAIVDRRFEEPFFEQTVDRAMQHPFNRLFSRRTPPAAVEAFAGLQPVIEPNGFIFHMSRCGSTLVGQLLAALSDTIVLAEAQPLDAVLALAVASRSNEDQAKRLLRAMVHALAQPRRGECRLFVKFHAWHVLLLPLIARAFPGVPWIFVFREPRAVLRSHDAIPGREVLAGAVAPELSGIPAGKSATMSNAEHTARMLAAFCDAAIRAAASDRAAFIDYATLPGSVASTVARHFGCAPSVAERERMDAVAQTDTKRPGSPFRERSPELAADVVLDGLAARFLDARYATLRQLAAR
jgi:hypothetical protein